jgi:hypothetical protein
MCCSRTLRKADLGECVDDRSLLVADRSNSCETSDNASVKIDDQSPLRGPCGNALLPIPAHQTGRADFGHREIQLNCSLAVLEWQVTSEQTGGIAMSKAQKGNKEKKKPKADKNQPKTHVSAYKAAQDQAKPSFNPFAKKT